MKTKRQHKAASATPLSAFWDTSGIVPLCELPGAVGAGSTNSSIETRQVVWWATGVEAVSSFSRLKRDGHLTPKECRQALERLEHLRHLWNEIQPTEEVRHGAERLLSSHQLGAADALHLSAALIWCGNHPRGRVFIGADNKLSDAAEGEGFTVIRLS